MDIPQELLRNIYWAFREPKYSTQSDFIIELKKYHKIIAGVNLKIDFNDIAFNFPKVVIQYVKYTKNDILEPQVLLIAENSQNFTLSELLYKIHNFVGVNLFSEDNCFFEGLTFATDDDPDYPDIPVYFLDTGS